jgi:hypothetical protein
LVAAFEQDNLDSGKAPAEGPDHWWQQLAGGRERTDPQAAPLEAS